MANYLNLDFNFREIEFTESQILESSWNDKNLDCHLINFNNFFKHIFGDPVPWERPTKNIVLVDARKLTLVLLKNLFFAYLGKKIVLINLQDCYHFTNQNPDLYALITQNLENHKFMKTESSIPDIHVHLRLVNFAKDSERYLNPEYYYACIRNILESQKDLYDQISIFLHSDFPNEINISPSTENITPETLKYLVEINVLDNQKNFNRSILNEAISFREQLIKEFINVVICDNDSAYLTFLQMINATYLITSKSSFSFVAGLLNKKGEIHTPNYWNRTPSSWIKYNF